MNLSLFKKGKTIAHEVEGMTLHFRKWSFGERTQYLQAIEKDNNFPLLAEIVAKTVCNEDGSLLFNLDDVNALRADVVDDLFMICAKVNGSAPTSLDDAKKKLEDSAELNFVFDLALALGKTVEELGSMSSIEYTYWLAKYQRQPWGSEVDDIRFAMTPYILAEINRKQGSRPFQLSDFMVQRSNNHQTQTKEEFFTIVRAQIDGRKAGKGRDNTNTKQSPNEKQDEGQ